MMRTDKKTSNHISTVMGTLLELAEHISQNELRIRMMDGEAASTYDSLMNKLEKEVLGVARGKARLENSDGGGASKKRKKM